MSAVNRFLGDSPLRVLVKLIVISFLVGIVMSVMGWSPYDVIYGVRDLVLNIYYMGFDAFGRFIDYFLVGAIIVVPAFFIIRLLSYRRG
ncbi:MAG: DUF6460 domain-containing protein [Aliihoeflea sp.]|uniref:DUF6460 domain-containing protein n=1 Tax=Aliihoeflea sp. 40Bstr573 TaxID=2696467 RepID=UPI0020961598|nr:DUF6460 domain-containing protein [Aliihoeflea sp. 40Bstr573]MCO6389067.1 hypothetical protein [Aliihoeflea sp. 40Bstr573]